MNIFLLDQDPAIAAQMQCDKHVVKMIVESGQMLSTAHRMLDGWIETAPGTNRKRWYHPYFDDVLYKAVHMNHPCTLWTREGYDNYMWHYEHFKALCQEYTHRYGKVHSAETKLDWLLRTAPNKISPIPTVFRMAVGDFPWMGSQVETYRHFYFEKRKRMPMKWTMREIPEWYRDLESRTNRSDQDTLAQSAT